MEILLGAFAYIIVTFPLAVLWHMKLFNKKFRQWGYMGDDAQPLLGLSSMILQGLILSYGYKFLNVNHSSMTTGIAYAMFMGLFLWTVFVLAGMGKSSKIRHTEFFLLETIYLSIQFLIYGILISLIFS